jgi:hypothetical protein
MEPYIKNVDVTKPIGKLVHKLCRDERDKGFIAGFFTGILFSVSFYVVFTNIKKN